MRFALAIALPLLGGACGAPKAAPIGGDISSVLERAVAEGTKSFDHGAWDELVSRHAVDEGRRFDYASLKKEEVAFEEYIEALAGSDLAELSAPEIEALFINAYNAYTVRTVLAHVSPDGAYQIESIQDVDDVFSRKDHVVGGFRLSLDNMEHNILRPLFRDPRLHFSVNCASISCPPLPTQAFTGDAIDEQLDVVTRKALTSPDYVTVEADGLVLTKILDWYGSDFVSPDYRGSEESLPAYVRKYATDDVREAIEERGNGIPVRFRDYDWGLNRPLP